MRKGQLLGWQGTVIGLGIATLIVMFSGVELFPAIGLTLGGMMIGMGQVAFMIDEAFQKAGHTQEPPADV